MKNAKFDIGGMTCSSCSSHVEKAVSKLDGIKSVNVNLLLNNMVVEYDERAISNDKIIDAVINAGYYASLHEDIEVERKDEKNKGNKEIKSMKKRLVISLCFLIPLMYIAMHHMLYEWLKIPIPQIITSLFDGNKNSIIFSFTQFLLLLPIIYVNREYYITGFKRLFKGTPNMDSLIALGSSASTIYGIFAIYMIGYGLGHNNINLVEKYSMDIYFESAGTIITLITLGKYLETKSKVKTGEEISKLINLAPKTASVIRDGKEIEVKTEEIILGDIVAIKPGSSIPVDGIVIEGRTLVDESSITGESIPVEKNLNDTVISGTVNKNGNVKVKATRVGSNTTLSQIVSLVEEAVSKKAPISKLADKVSLVFVPLVIIIAILTFVIWIVLGQSFEFALTSAVAVLVISCPCALGLATGKGAQNGIIIKSGESLELLHLVDTVVLDKTGTITNGEPKVTDVISVIKDDKLLQIAGSLEKNSEHPLSEAILEIVKEKNIELKKVNEFKAIFGRGIEGKIDGKKYYGGNLYFIKENNIEIKEFNNKIQSLQKEGKTCLYFANENEIIGIIAVADPIKETSIKAIQELKKNNLDVIMLTGDNKVSADSIGSKLKIDKIISEVMPQDKEKEIYKLQKQGKKVAFVGDGINDSPALVKADVGIAIGSGTDIAIDSADIVLIKNSLLDVVTAISLSKKTIRNIKQNLFWAFLYNTIGIPIAAGLLYSSLNIRLNPMIGAAAMSLSSVCVITNALRLRKFKVSYGNDKNIYNKMEVSKMKNIIKKVYIEGMQCNHCKMTVEKSLENLDGVKSVKVNLDDKTAVIELEKNIEDNNIKEKIVDAGFEVSKIE